LNVHSVEPGKSYRLAFVARATDAGAGAVWVRFRDPVKHETIRSYGQDVTSPSARTYTTTFDAPAFADLGEVR
jgi:hypothetical protein